MTTPIIVYNICTIFFLTCGLSLYLNYLKVVYTDNY